MAIGYDGGAYSGNLDEISLALGVEPDIEGVTSLEGTPVDPLGHLQDATILGGMPYSESILARLAQHSPEVVRDLMRGRTYMAGEGLLGQGYMEDPLLQQISVMDDTGDTIHLGMKMGETHDEYLDRITAQDDFEETLESITPTISKSLVKDAQDKLSEIYGKDYTKEVIKDRIQGATTDAVRSLIDPEEYDALPLDDILSGTQSFEVETPLGTTDIYDTETGEWTALTDTEDDLTAQKELAELIALNPTGRFRSTIDANDVGTFEPYPVSKVDGIANTSAIRRAAEMSGLTMDAAYPSIDTTVQDTQADVMDEGYLAGLNMTAEESHALTRALNTLRVGGRKPYPHEIEARKQGAIVNPLTSRYATSRQLLEEEETSDLYNTGYLEGLSQAMKNVLENDPDLMAQYMAARSDIISQLDKTKFEHEDWYPGSQAAATGAGYWGPLALGWNASYNDYKDAQRALMGKQPGQRFDSGDWINNLGWMTPAQINRLLGYGEP